MRLKPRHQILLAIVLALACPIVRAQVMDLDTKWAQSYNNDWVAKQVANGVLELPRGTLHLSRTIETKPKVGCLRVITRGASGYAETDTLHRGYRSIVVNHGKGPVLRLSGAGSILEDPAELHALDPEAAVVEIEGRSDAMGIATGRHSFKHKIFRGGKYGVRALAGYYQDGTFVPCEQHGEACKFELCEFWEQSSAFRLENQQALNWVAEDCSFCVLRDSPPMIVVDCARGGMFSLVRPRMWHPRTTLFRLWDDDFANYGPNVAVFKCEGLQADRFTDQEFWLTLVSYKGKVNERMRSLVDIDGFVPTRETTFDQSRMLDVPAGLPREGWKIDVVTKGLDREAEVK